MLSNTPHSNRTRSNATGFGKQDLDQNGKAGIGNTRSKCQNGIKLIQNDLESKPPKSIDINVDYYRGIIDKPEGVPLAIAADLMYLVYEKGDCVIEYRPSGYRFDGFGKGYADIRINGLIGKYGYILLRLFKDDWPGDIEESDKVAEVARLFDEWKPGYDWMLKGYAFTYLQVELPGNYLERFTAKKNVRHIIYMEDTLGIRDTRVDLRIDDHGKKVPVEEILRTQSNQCTGFRGGVKPVNLCVGDYLANPSPESLAEVTLNLASRESDRCCRIYPTLIKHGFDATRIETEFKGDHARAVTKVLKEIPKGAEVESTIAGLVIGWFDFKEASLTGVRASRRDRLPWWQEFLDDLGSAIKVSVPRVSTTLEQKAKWLIGYTSRTLAMVNKVIPGFAKELLTIGTDKLNAVDLRQIELWRKMSYG